MDTGITQIIAGLRQLDSTISMLEIRINDLEKKDKNNETFFENLESILAARKSRKDSY